MSAVSDARFVAEYVWRAQDASNPIGLINSWPSLLERIRDAGLNPRAGLGLALVIVWHDKVSSLLETQDLQSDAASKAYREVMDAMQ